MDSAHRTARLAGRRRGGLLRSVAFGFLVTALVEIGFLLLASFLLMQTDDPAKNASLFGFLGLSLATFIGGFAAGRRNKGQGALAGLTLGGVVLLLLFLLSLFLPNEGSTLLFALVTRATLVLFALFGGIWGGSTASRRRRR
ncbi:MAG: TIGR04086 family membrane protein [Clostridia bacterium]|nr:TIGR04086 family membrane protein [Clostridia bacterium]